MPIVSRSVQKGSCTTYVPSTVVRRGGALAHGLSRLAHQFARENELVQLWVVTVQ
jgi:hypothetical protein